VAEVGKQYLHSAMNRVHIISMVVVSGTFIAKTRMDILRVDHTSSMTKQNSSLKKKDKPLHISIYHQKVGDFILATPSLRLLDKFVPNIAFGVPDVLLELYTHHAIFKNVMAQSKLGPLDDREVIDLSYPTLRFKKMPLHWKRLPRKPFLLPQSSAKAYHEALRTIFHQLPEVFEPAPFLETEAEADFLEKMGLSPFKYFTFHPGSGAQHKNWPMKNYVSVVRELLQKFPGLTPVALLGPSEKNISFDDTREIVQLRTDLLSVSKVLAGSLFHLDNDSGIHHLAGAMDVPTITVFGTSAPGHWASLSKRNYLVWAGVNNINSILPDDVVKPAIQIMSQYVGFF
jgi:ADP-heptose:LPS heptosyltransferase